MPFYQRLSFSGALVGLSPCLRAMSTYVNTTSAAFGVGSGGFSMLDIDRDAPGCLELTQRVLPQNSWQEQAVDLGMRVALVLGNRSGTVKLYKQLEMILAPNLGIALQNQPQQLLIEIMKQPANN